MKRYNMKLTKALRTQYVRTAALVADGAVGEFAALGDGDGHLRLDAGAPHGAGQQHGAQARVALVRADVAHGRAARGRRPGPGSCAAFAHGASFSATFSAGVLPHLPAACATCHGAAMAAAAARSRKMIGDDLIVCSYC